METSLLLSPCIQHSTYPISDVEIISSVSNNNDDNSDNTILHNNNSNSNNIVLSNYNLRSPNHASDISSHSISYSHNNFTEIKIDTDTILNTSNNNDNDDNIYDIKTTSISFSPIKSLSPLKNFTSNIESLKSSPVSISKYLPRKNNKIGNMNMSSSNSLREKRRSHSSDRYNAIIIKKESFLLSNNRNRRMTIDTCVRHNNYKNHNIPVHIHVNRYSDIKENENQLTTYI
jgi:hypothetical protein